MKIFYWLLCILFIIAAISVGLAFQSPTFVAGLTTLAVTAAVKAILPKAAKRMTPEEEQRWRDTIARGEEWDPVKKRARIR